MAVCNECKFFQKKEDDSERGFCKGNEVLSNLDTRDCPQKSYQRRIDNWLVDPYKKMFDTLRENVKHFFEDKADDDLFTLHDVSHCINVEKMIKVIVTKSQNDFSTVERFILSCAAWTHDLGMNKEVAKQYFADVKIFGDSNEALRHRRDEHHNASSWYVINRQSELFKGNDQKELILVLVRIVSTIIQYHRKIEDISACQDITMVRGEIVRTQLLAAVFRLADTLHKDITRFDPNLYAMIQISSTHRTSRLHWLKSYVVSNIHLNEYEQTITVQLSLPEYKQFVNLHDRRDDRLTNKKIKNWEERIRNLKYIIATDIEEDLIVVNEVFSKYAMPTYVKVSTPILHVRGYSNQYVSDIDSVLSELDILFSPNTSKVISRAIDALRLHYLSPSEGNQKYSNRSNQILDYLKDVYKDRPCHVGLGRIIDLLTRCGHGDESKKQQLPLLLQKINEYRQRAMNTLCDKADQIISPDIKRIILIGYSSSIVNILEKLASVHNIEKREVEVIVLECAPKRRLGHSNVIEYNDGIHYANEIGKIDFYNVKILPDIGLATLLDSAQENGSLTNNSLVLFGAN